MIDDHGWLGFNLKNFADVSPADLEEFLIQHLPQRLERTARAAICEIPDLPHSYPGPGSTGHANSDHVLRYVLRARSFLQAGNRQEAKRSWGRAMGWLEGWTLPVTRDNQHRYLEGAALAWDTLMELEPRYIADRVLVREALQAHVDPVIASLETLHSEYAIGRIVLRTVASAVTLTLTTRNPTARMRHHLIRIIPWFWGRVWTWPHDDDGETWGWGKDDRGVPFQADMQGSYRNETEWKDTHNAWYQPFISFSMQARVLAMLFDCDWSRDAFRVLLFTRGRNLRAFARAVLVDHENPVHRGWGPTKGCPLFADVDLEKRAVRVGPPKPPYYTTGGAYYAPWLLVAGKDEERLVPRMLEAHVDQCLLRYGGVKTLGESIWDPEMLWLVQRWKGRNTR